MASMNFGRARATRLIPGGKLLFATTACLALVGLPAFANVVKSYTLTSPATVSDGSTLSGSWTVDFTTSTVLALNIAHSAGDFSASTFDLTGAPVVSNVGGFVPGDWLLQDYSTGGGFQNFNIVFNQITGAIFTGTAGFGSALDLNPGHSTAFTAFRLISGAGTTQATDVPEPATWAMMLVGFGALGAVLRRRRGLTALAA